MEGLNGWCGEWGMSMRVWAVGGHGREEPGSMVTLAWLLCGGRESWVV